MPHNPKHSISTRTSRNPRLSSTLRPVAERPAGRSRRGIHWKLVLIVLIGGAIVLGLAYLRDRMHDLPELRTVKVEHRELRLTVGATGTIEPREIAEVGAVVPGKIIAFGLDPDNANRKIDVGSRVQQGTALLQLDRELYEVGLRKATAAQRLALAEVGRLEAQLRQATLNRERADRLAATNSQSQLDTAITAHEMAQAELGIARARFEQASAEVQQAEINLERTTIRAPFDGVIIDRRANLGQNVGPGLSGLFLLARDLKQMRIRASVGEADIGKIFVGQPVTFTVDAHRNSLMTGQVQKVLLNARVQSNFVTYDVLVGINDAARTLLPNMTADVQFETARSEQAWLAPAGSLQWWPNTEQIAASVGPIEPADLARAGQTDDQEQPAPGSRAIVWVPSGNGKVRPLTVRVGIGDGVVTEIIAEQLQEEMPIVVGTVKKTTLARIIPSVKLSR